MNEGQAALIEAIKVRQLDKVRELTENNADIAAINPETGESPLLLAVYHGADDIASYLHSLPVQRNLFEAAAIGDTARVRALLRDDPGLASAFAPDGFTALGLASFFGYPEVVELLLAAGADPNVPSCNAMRVAPLHSAAAHRHAGIAELLIAKGADVNAKTHGGWTPLLEAAKNNDTGLLSMLLAHGADPSETNDEGMSALAIAELEDKKEAAALLLDFLSV